MSQYARSALYAVSNVHCYRRRAVEKNIHARSKLDQANALAGDVNRLWDGGDDLRKGSVDDLRKAVSADPKIRVLIVHGWNDLSCPFMGSLLTVDQMPIMGDLSRVAVREYPGGHMFYTRPTSRDALRKDVMEMYSLH